MRVRVLPVLLAGIVGIVIMAMVWWAGPGLFASEPTPEERVVTATVVEPAGCDEPRPVERVLIDEGEDGEREALLNACGHDQDEHIEVAVPAEAGEGTLTVRGADSLLGYSSFRLPVGLVLLALSCLGGGAYAHVVTAAGRGWQLGKATRPRLPAR